MGNALDFAWNTLNEFYRYAAPYWPVLFGLIGLYIVILCLSRRKPQDCESREGALAYFSRLGYELAAVHSQGRMSAEYTFTRFGARVRVNLRWGRKAADEKSVAAAAGVRDSQDYDFVMLISKEGFTRQARRLGLETGVCLLSGRRLEAELKQFDGNITQGMKAVAAGKSRS